VLARSKEQQYIVKKKEAKRLGSQVKEHQAKYDSRRAMSLTPSVDALPMDTRPAKVRTLRFYLNLDNNRRMSLSVFVLVSFALATQLWAFRQTAGLVHVRSDAVTLIVSQMIDDRPYG
jgi:hypothetical protein